MWVLFFGPVRWFHEERHHLSLVTEFDPWDQHKDGRREPTP